MRWVAALLGLAILLCVGGVSKAYAQRDLSRRDRLFVLYYNYYANQQSQQRILREQKRISMDLRGVRDFEEQRIARIDPIERYVREGRVSDPRSAQVPPIYSGAGRRNYFMRYPAFNPPQR